ncbi:ankyrin repeat domain-containing protein [Legionella sp. CNM-1927-20]|uniref:ankyrin repeat domain-containing protein n=1 Tax=Legionella sp. CNM-1927-20 TaxID=3422221 RepID=UPI00403B32F0
MYSHQAIFNLYQALGYHDGFGGLCYGFAVRWLEASLLGKAEQQRFEERIQRIITTPTLTLYEAILKAQEKDKQEHTKEDEDLLDIRYFYDSLILFYEPENWAFLFNQERYLSQTQLDLISTLTSSNDIKERGGLRTLYSEPLIFNQLEVENYLEQLADLLEQSSEKISDQPIGLLLSNRKHVVALVYKPDQGWAYRDINQDPDSNYTFDTKTIAANIIRGFSGTNNDDYITFNAKIVLTNLDIRSNYLEKRLLQFKQEHPINKDIAKRKADPINLVYTAAQYNHFELINDLAKHGADLNQADEMGMTPLATAVYDGHLNTVTTLANLGAQVNQPDHSGKTPLFIAAQQGHFDVVKALLSYQADCTYACNFSKEQLIEFVDSYNNDIRQRAYNFVQNWKMAQPIKVKPENIAEIMGHNEVAELIKQLTPQDSPAVMSKPLKKRYSFYQQETPILPIKNKISPTAQEEPGPDRKKIKIQSTRFSKSS